jgi:hypothetical protein
MVNDVYYDLSDYDRDVETSRKLRSENFIMSGHVSDIFGLGKVASREGDLD